MIKVFGIQIKNCKSAKQFATYIQKGTTMKN